MKRRIVTQKVAILADNGFEESELAKPLESLKKAGATVHVISPQTKKVKAWATKDWGKEYDVDVKLSVAKSKDYDVLVLPGGVMNPDKLRINSKALAFIKDFFSKDKIVAAICHGPWSLIDAKVVKGKKMTSYRSIKTDLINAGVKWEDKEVVIDGKLITSRSPKDLPAFIKTIINKMNDN